MWFLTKKRWAGVSHVSKYSTGVSRSRKRNERMIRSSLPGIAKRPVSAAQENNGDENEAASAAPEVVRRKSLLENIAYASRMGSRQREEEKAHMACCHM